VGSWLGRPTHPNSDVQRPAAEHASAETAASHTVISLHVYLQLKSWSNEDILHYAHGVNLPGLRGLTGSFAEGATRTADTRGRWRSSFGGGALVLTSSCNG